MSNLLSLVAGLGSGIIDGITDLFGMQGQAHYQRVNMREAARLQHDENVYWANYNTPAAQMQRLKEAGLNPNLVYGNGADAQFQGQVSPSGSMPSYRGGYGVDMLSAANMIAQNENLKANSEVLFEEARYKRELADAEALKNRRTRSGVPEYMGWIDRKKAWQDFLNSVGTGEKIQSETMLNDAQRQLAQLTYNVDSETRYQIQHEVLTSYELQNSIAELQRDNFITQMVYELGLKHAQAQQALASVAMLKSLAILYEKETDNKVLEGIGLSIANETNAIKRDFTKWNVEQDTTFWSKFWDKWIGKVTGSLGKLFGGSTTYHMESSGSPRTIVSGFLK